MKKIATTQKSIMARPISFLWPLVIRLGNVRIEEEKNQPCEPCPFLGCSPDLLVDEEVEHGQESERKDVHEDKVQPGHVYLHHAIVESLLKKIHETLLYKKNYTFLDLKDFKGCS